MKGKSRLKPGSNLRYRRLLAHILIFSVSERTADCKRLTDLRALYDIEVTHPGCQRARGVELEGDARDVSLPISSHYQTVPSNIFIK